MHLSKQLYRQILRDVMTYEGRCTSAHQRKCIHDMEKSYHTSISIEMLCILLDKEVIKELTAYFLSGFT